MATSVSPLILVVDDDRSVRPSLGRLLRAHACTVIEAESAASALAAAAEHRPHLIVMDLHMPDGSGVEAARKLRRDSALANTPIIALTATPPHDEETIAIFEAVLEKPCSAEVLIRTLRAALPAKM